MATCMMDGPVGGEAVEADGLADSRRNGAVDGRRDSVRAQPLRLQCITAHPLHLKCGAVDSPASNKQTNKRACVPATQHTALFTPLGGDRAHLVAHCPPLAPTWRLPACPCPAGQPPAPPHVAVASTQSFPTGTAAPPPVSYGRSRNRSVLFLSESRPFPRVEWGVAFMAYGASCGGSERYARSAVPLAR
eukprot:7318605-Prymnesium_polylepis.1